MSLLETTKQFELPSIPPMRGTEFSSEGFYLWGNFKEYFVGKKEPKQSKQKYKLSTLKESSTDSAIMAELGDCEVTLGQFHAFLKTADKNGWYIAYTRDLKGSLWAVYCRWDGGEWRVDAGSITGTGPWRTGCQFFSRDSQTSDTQSSTSLEPFDPLTLEVVINGVTFIPKL